VLEVTLQKSDLTGFRRSTTVALVLEAEKPVETIPEGGSLDLKLL
jgi:hypothetical protein